MRATLKADRRAGFSKVLVLAGVIVVLGAVGLGLAVAYAVTSAPKQPVAVEAPRAQPQDVSAPYDYVPFGSVVANLSEGRLTRYVQVSLVLKVQKDSGEAMRKCLDGGQKVVFTNWLLTYLSDKTLDEVEGAAAITRLQREIDDGFNAILAQSGGPKIEAVLFEEFNVQ